MCQKIPYETRAAALEDARFIRLQPMAFSDAEKIIAILC